MDGVSVERLYPTPFSNSPLLPLLLLTLLKQRHAPRTVDSFHREYDYIVVGSGSGGSAVASRLSEIPCIKVLLIEAGKIPPLISEVPAVSRSFFLTDIDWNYYTEPQKHTGAGLINRQVSIPTGKALGGSTIDSLQLHFRGNRKDYDIWEDSGATGWSYQDVLPYFKKLEDNWDFNFIKNGFHGVDGPVTVHEPWHKSELGEAIDEAVYKMNLRKVDPNGPEQMGFSHYQANLRVSQKCTAAKAYLVPAENRTNLHILPNAFVKKIIIKNRRAIGVRFDYDGDEYEVGAKREVIVSAGTFNTPKLLKLSGIGPRDELEKFGIPVVKDLPVGFNLQEQCAGIMTYTLSASIPPLSKRLADPRNIKTYVKHKKGPLANVGGMGGVAFLTSDRYPPSGDYPIYQINFAEVDWETFSTKVGFKPEVYKKVYAPYENSTIYVCLAKNLRPRSRGYVALRSADPYDDPVIDPNLLHHPLDVIDIVEGMKDCNVIANSKSLRRIGSKPLATLYPGCEHLANNEDRYFMCMVRLAVTSFSHPVGTAKMGDPSDPLTVVDPYLRVKGIKSLRVVDASVMPTMPSGGPMVPAMMIGEKASDMIKKTIKCY